MFNNAYNSCTSFFSKAYQKCKSAINKIPVIGSLRRKRNSEGSNKTEPGVQCIQIHVQMYRKITRNLKGTEFENFTA